MSKLLPSRSTAAAAAPAAGRALERADKTPLPSMGGAPRRGGSAVASPHTAADSKVPTATTASSSSVAPASMAAAASGSSLAGVERNDPSIASRSADHHEQGRSSGSVGTPVGSPDAVAAADEARSNTLTSPAQEQQVRRGMTLDEAEREIGLVVRTSMPPRDFPKVRCCLTPSPLRF